MSSAPRKPRAPRSPKARVHAPSRRTKCTIALAAAVSFVVLVAILLAINSGRRQDDTAGNTEVAEAPPHLVDLSLTPAADPFRDFEQLQLDLLALAKARPADVESFRESASDVTERLAVPPFRESPHRDRGEEPFFADLRLRQRLAGHAFDAGFIKGSVLAVPVVGKRAGTTPNGLRAIDDAHAWLVEHQLSDGSWSFDHRDGVCNGRCSDPGKFADERSAATGLALLTLIRGGHVRADRQHDESVQKGLRYLLVTQRTAPIGGASWGDAITHAQPYAHAIATLAMCEAAAEAQRYVDVARDIDDRSRPQLKERLRHSVPIEVMRRSGQAAAHYIDAVQHDEGGWRYTYQMPGDTSVTTWMLMALRASRAAGLRIRGDSVARVQRFLATTAARDGGPVFFYLPDKRQSASEAKATTAMGWLCRVSMGASRDSPAVLSGADQLLAWGPQIGEEANFYYNYHATQVLHVVGGKHWTAWHAPLRDYLVAAQNRDPRDHAFGSWYVATDPSSSPGGRLYCTAVAALTLQVICTSPDP